MFFVASLPKGAIVKIPIQTINKSKEIWGEDAEEFRCGIIYYIPVRIYR